MKPLVIWGGGGHAKVVAEAVRRLGIWNIHGFIDDVTLARRGEAFAGSRVLGGRQMLPGLLAAGVRDMVLAFGHCEVRVALWKEMTEFGFQFPVICDPASIVSSSASLGPGCFLGPAAVINADAKIGAQVIVNTGAIVEHDCVVGEGVHLAPRSCLAGHVTVGRVSLLGAGSVVRDHLTLGEGCVVGMGSVVLQDVAVRTVVYGCPARTTGAVKE